MSQAAAAAARERRRVDAGFRRLEQIGWNEGQQIVACDECGLEQVQGLDSMGQWRDLLLEEIGLRSEAGPLPPAVCVVCGCETARHVRIVRQVDSVNFSSPHSDNVATSIDERSSHGRGTRRRRGRRR